MHFINANNYDDINQLAQIVRQATRHGSPRIGIVCGSGLGKFAELLEDQEVLPFRDIPNFPITTVPGHVGRFVFGTLEGKSVLCVQGRVHPYEGYQLATSAIPIRLMKVLGIETVILTNAAGGLNEYYKTGDIVILKDHIFLPGLAGNGPLSGGNDEKFGPRFVPMGNAYNSKLRKLAQDTARELVGCTLHEGVYCMVGGPQFETPAECRMLRQLGADVVGMSTAHEVTVARHCGLQVLGLSLVSNKCEMEEKSECESDDIHAKVLATGDLCADKLCTLVRAIVKKL